MGNCLGLGMFGEEFCLFGVGIEGIEGDIELQRGLAWDTGKW